jgi:transcription elongation factor SPT5
MVRQVLTNDGQLGREANIIFQICRRCLACSGTCLLAIMSTFARSSIPGYVFIEAYNIAEVRCAMDGFVTVYDKQLEFILPVDYIGLIFWRSHSSPRIEDGQWVSCLVGKYRDDIGYVCKSNFPINEWCAVIP